MIDLDEANIFFADPRSKPMPKWMRDSVDSGNYVKSGAYTAQTIEYKSLMNIFAPDLAERLQQDSRYAIPVLRVTNTPDYLVYNPRTGEYVGQFDISTSDVIVPEEDRRRGAELLDKLKEMHPNA